MSATLKLDYDTFHKLAGNVQGDILKWYRKRVKRTCRSMGIKDFWRATTWPQRRVMWRSLWDQDPARKAVASNAKIAASLPIAEIYSWNGPVHLKWQAYCKTTFVATAELCFRYGYLENRNSELTGQWKSLPMSTTSKALGLGNHGMIPIKDSRPID